MNQTIFFALLFFNLQREISSAAIVLHNNSSKISWTTHVEIKFRKNGSSALPTPALPTTGNNPFDLQRNVSQNLWLGSSVQSLCPREWNPVWAQIWHLSLDQSRAWAGRDSLFAVTRGGRHSNQEQIIGPGLACALILLDKRNPWQYSSFSLRVPSSPLAWSSEDLRRCGGASATRTWTWTRWGGWTRDKWSKIAQIFDSSSLSCPAISCSSDLLGLLPFLGRTSGGLCVILPSTYGRRPFCLRHTAFATSYLWVK